MLHFTVHQHTHNQLMVSDELCHMLHYLSSQHHHHLYKHRVNTVYTECVQHLLGQQFRLVIHCMVSTSDWSPYNNPNNIKVDSVSYCTYCSTYFVEHLFFHNHTQPIPVTRFPISDITSTTDTTLSPAV